MVEITSEEQNKVKRMKTTDDSVRHLWDNIQLTSIRIIGVPEEEEKKKGKLWERSILISGLSPHYGVNEYPQ